MLRILLLVLASLVSGYDVQWAPLNVSLIENEKEFTARKTTLQQTNIGQYKALYFASICPGKSDGIFGAAYAGGMSGQPPTIQLGYFPLASTWPGTNAVNGDYSAATGFIAATFLKLDEVTLGGRVVQSIPLSTLPFSLQSVTYTDDLYGSSFLGGAGQSTSASNALMNYGNLAVTFPVSASTVAGLLASGIVLTAETMGFGVQITGFPYLQNQTSIRLTIAQVTVNKDRNDDSRELLHTDRTTVGMGSHAMYMDIGTFALCDGERKRVTIETNYSCTTDDLQNYKLVNQQLTDFMKAGRSVSIRVKDITFPSGALDISYDTSIGATQGPIVVGEELDALPQLTGGQVAAVVIGCLIGVGAMSALFFHTFARFNNGLILGNSVTNYTKLPETIPSTTDTYPRTLQPATLPIATLPTTTPTDLPTTTYNSII